MDKIIYYCPKRKASVENHGRITLLPKSRMLVNCECGEPHILTEETFFCEVKKRVTIRARVTYVGKPGEAGTTVTIAKCAWCLGSHTFPEMEIPQTPVEAAVTGD